jgi:hypothetical protein
MAEAAADPVLPEEVNQLTLLDLLSNTLVLTRTVPHLPVASILRLAATSHAFRDLVYGTPGIFRHLDLSHVRSAKFEIAAIDHGGQTWRNVQMDENLTEDEHVSPHLQGEPAS